jgi:hypothetical protein
MAAGFSLAATVESRATLCHNPTPASNPLSHGFAEVATVPAPHAFVQDLAETDELDDDTRYRRLTSCPHCAGRRRTLVEVGSRLVGRCLGCGEELPLETEWQSHVVIVGRAGQGILTTDPGGD